METKPAQATKQVVSTVKKVVKSEQITGKFNPPFGVETRVTGFLNTPPFGPNPNTEQAKDNKK